MKMLDWVLSFPLVLAYSINEMGSHCCDVKKLTQQSVQSTFLRA